MPLSKQERIELLKKARQIKKEKADARKAEMLANPPRKGRRPKASEEEKTLDLELPKEEPPKELEPEVEEIIEVQKIKKPKKIIRKRIIQEYESNTDEEEEIIQEAPINKAKPPQARAKEVERPVEMPKPREVDITQSTPSFNFFGY